MRIHSFAIVTLMLLLGTGNCLAGPSDSAAKTPEYKEAMTALGVNDLTRAYRALASLWAKEPTFDVATTMGQIELQDGKFREAADHLAFGIRYAPTTKTELITKAKSLLAQAKAHIVTLKVSVDQPGADVAVDGKPIGKSPIDSEVFVEPGQHRISAVHSTLGSAEQKLVGKAGEAQAISLTLVATAAAPQFTYAATDLDGRSANTAVSEPPQTGKRSGIQPKTIVLIVGGAVTVAAGATTVVFALKGKSERDDMDKALQEAEDQYGSNPCQAGVARNRDICQTITQDRRDSNRSNRIANGFLIGTGAAAVGTAVVWLLWPSQHNKTSQLTVLPIAAPHQSGLVLSGSF